ncbi:MAG TPA: V4R domain-containing protein [Gemmatimonadaceae bacterium]|nr:V4R domain-containing protein [Gemmatimonadaceae bacterium]
MIQHIELSDNELVAVSRTALAALRQALLREAGPAASSCIQEAGYAGGDVVFECFRDWLRAQGKANPEELEMSEFTHRASLFFKELGWGTLTVSALSDAVAMVETADWGEADPQAALDHPACHFTTGMFADFFGRLSGAPLAVLEVECRSMGAPRCRFLLGSSEVLQHIFQEMERGTSYQDAARQLA